MKTFTDKVLMLAVLAAFVTNELKAQDPRSCAVKLNAGCETLCAYGTYEVGPSFCVGTLIQATGATSYTWYADNWGVVSTATSFSFVPSTAGSTVFTVHGTCGDGSTGYEVITIKVLACTYTSTTQEPTGIEELQPGAAAPPTYWDLMGNRIERPLKGLYIERRGTAARKVYIIDTNQ